MLNENKQLFEHLEECGVLILIILCLCFRIMTFSNLMAKALGSGVEKQLIKKALTKGTIYPIVKSIIAQNYPTISKTASSDAPFLMKE